MNTKTISFGQWKTWAASRIIDIDRRIHILRETKNFVKDDMKRDYYKVIASLAMLSYGLNRSDEELERTTQ